MNLVGHYIRGALFDGESLYLVEANRRILRIQPYADIHEGAQLITITNCQALYGVHVKEFISTGEATDVDDGHGLKSKVRTYRISTSGGKCYFTIKTDPAATDLAVKITDHTNASPHAGLRKVTDF